MLKPPTPTADVILTAQTCMVCGVNTAAELAGIYRGIAVDIPYPATAFWSGR